MEQSADISILLDSETNRTFHLAEINAAPQWLWTALVQQMVESGWTVQVTRQSIAVRVPVSSSGATPTNPCPTYRPDPGGDAALQNFTS